MAYNSEDDFVIPAPRPKRDKGRRPVLTEENDSPFKNRSHSKLFSNKSRNSNKSSVEKEKSKTASQKSSSQSSQESVELTSSSSHSSQEAKSTRRHSSRIEKTPTQSPQISAKSSQQSAISSQLSAKSSQQLAKNPQQSAKSSQRSAKSSQQLAKSSQQSAQSSQESQPARGRKSVSPVKTSTQRRQSQGREASKEKSNPVVTSKENSNLVVTSSTGQTRARRSLVPLTSPETTVSGKRKSTSLLDGAVTSSTSVGKRKSVTSVEVEERGRAKRVIKPTAKAAGISATRSQEGSSSNKPQTPKETANSQVTNSYYSINLRTVRILNTN